MSWFELNNFFKWVKIYPGTWIYKKWHIAGADPGFLIIIDTGPRAIHKGAQSLEGFNIIKNVLMRLIRKKSLQDGLFSFLIFALLLFCLVFWDEYMYFLHNLGTSLSLICLKGCSTVVIATIFEACVSQWIYSIIGATITICRVLPLQVMYDLQT